MTRLLGVMLVLSSLVCAQSSNEQPPIPLEAAQDSVPKVIRDARNTSFNVRTSFSMIDAAPDTPGVPHPHTTLTFMNQPELPHAESDTVVVGNIIRVQPYLTADGKGIYTEYTLKVIETAKNAAPVSAVAGDVLTLLRRGGSARLSDGRVVKHQISNDVTPISGQQYLAFLKYQPHLEAFYYAKLWLIQGGVMKAIFPDDRAREHAGKSAYAGKPLSEALFAIKENLN